MADYEKHPNSSRNYYRKNMPNNDPWSDYHAIPKKKVVVSTSGGNKKSDNPSTEPDLSNWLKIVQVWDDFEGQEYEDIADALFDIVQELMASTQQKKEK